ncbi:MupA/Atu3671 family FMN-dependent luciferase-like monooxygenase [Altericroceibacterium xinjiangense]|uniref:MupA/Atu3671 family FMN-dependent luciferase-like monooxygenase n=1 Tax=Altericroceibacterium xinjiangense TaxID=762261 RepID=UPI001F49C1C5|nr:MupA/Atu3671 family FMN-dependent luciferase-like monooxygenase [Altericroceibacterium xinjiangense]
MDGMPDLTRAEETSLAGELAERRAEAGLRSILVGDETLLAECGNLLQRQGHEIAAVVAQPGPAADWARRSGLPLLSRPRDLLTASIGPVDYLFSISNLSVLPAEVLALASRAAINFHDGPLPDLAGLNTPVWALLNGASRHGVTWHLMTDTVDGGAVLAAESIEIADGESALSLNTRCFEAGLRRFAVLAQDLEAAVAAASPQPHLPSRIYGRGDRPTAAATIDWHDTAENIARLVTALDFGPYANPLGAPKALLGDRLLLVQQATVLESGSGFEPGTVVEWGIAPIVATGSKDVRLDRIAAIDGLPLYGLDEEGPRHFASLDPQRQARLTLLDSAAGKYEAWWRRRLQMRDTLHLPQFRARADGMQADWTEANRTLPAGRAGAEVLALVVAWLARAADRDTVEIGYADQVCRARLEDVSGWFAPELPMRVKVDFDRSLTDLRTVVQQEIAGLHKRVAIARDLLARSPELRGKTAFHHPVSVQVVESLDDACLDEHAVLNLTICVKGGTCRWTYDATRLDPAAAEDLWLGFEAMIASADASPEARVRELSLLSPAERDRVLLEWNATDAPERLFTAHHHLFALQAARTPDRAAVTSRGVSLTYAELDARSNQMARHLHVLGVRPNVLVGLHVPRSVDMLVCLLAIHKAGGAYVPLDPSYPQDRIAHMVADSGMRLILADTTLAKSLPSGQAEVICMDEVQEMAASLPAEPFDGGAGSDSLAYVIYTSGSTGLPKGVMVEHCNVLNFFAGMDDHLELEGTWLAVTSLSFDISVLELLWPLTRGYHVVIATEREVRGDVAPGASSRTAGFSLFYFASSDSGSPAEQYRLLLEGARFADTHGFEAVWTPERHFHAFGGPYPNPSVAAAAIAAITSRIQIRAGSVVGTLHHPIRIAEEWALVDNLSNGRVGIAFASGWQPNDFVLNPAAFKDRNGVLKSTMEDVRALWRGERRRFPGALGRDVELLTYPRPVQAELPCWITSAGNVDTFVEAGRVGANVLTHLLGQSVEEVAEKLAAYRKAWREAGHPGEGRVTLMLHTFLGEDAGEVRSIVRQPMIDYLRTATSLLQQYAWSFPAFKRPPGSSETDQVQLSDLSPEETDALMEHAFERYFDANGLFGTPEENVGFIQQLQSIGVDEIGCLIDFGIPADTVIEHLPILDRLRALTHAAAGEQEAPLHELMARHSVTHLQCTPSLLQVLASDEAARPALAALKRLMVGGEAFPPPLARDMRDLVKGTVMNMYGPTETTVWSAVHRLEERDETPPLGRPLANQQIYILDRHREPVRPGTPGELVIGGAGVVRGYLDRPELTSERFIPHPFVPGARAYRTGDLARQRADGTLEFLGRLDHQVKIRGYRIELGEIEAVLAGHDQIAEAVTVARREGAATRLMAYLTPRGPVAPPIDALRAHLRAQLPEFMVPGSFVFLDALPRTPNGKIDRKALPDPDTIPAQKPETRSATPSTEAEAAIQAIWCDLLKLPSVGLNDNFFDIGGHSLLAIQVHRRLAAVMPQPVALTDIFRFPTVSALGAHLASGLDEPAAAREGQDRALARRAAIQRRGAVRAAMRV